MYQKKHKNTLYPFKWKQFKGDIILWSVRWYCRYALSYRDLKEMAAERGLDIERSTLCRWVQEYGPELAKRIRSGVKQTGDSWRVDETYLKIKGNWHYLYRAIDKEGDTLDWMLSQQRNKKAAKRFFKKTLKNRYVKIPRNMNVDKNSSYKAAQAELQQEGEWPQGCRLRQAKYLNNSIENDHKFIKRKSRYRQWYQSFETAKNTIEGIEAMRMLQKGQVRYVAASNIRAQNDYLAREFGLAA